MWTSVSRFRDGYGKSTFHRYPSGAQRLKSSEDYWSHINSILRLFDGDLSLTEILSMTRPDLDMLVKARLKDIEKRNIGMQQARQLERMAKKL